MKKNLESFPESLSKNSLKFVTSTLFHFRFLEDFLVRRLCGAGRMKGRRLSIDAVGLITQRQA